MPAAQTTHGPIQIDWSQDGQVLVTGPDRHRFLLTMQQAADACARGKDQIVWKEEFDRLLQRVHSWLKDRASSISSAYLAVQDRQVVVFVVPRAATMDFALSDEIAQLEVELYQDFMNCPCGVRQIPGHTAEALTTFIDPEQSLLLYGQPLTASSAVGA